MGRLSSRRGKFTAGIAGFTAIATMALVLVLTAGPATAKQFATLHILAGSVEVDHGEGFSPGAELQTLREGDTVRTASDGRAEVEYFDGSATRLDYDTTFTIKRLESFPDEEGSKVIVGEQQEGQTFNRVVALTGSESRFETETPTATASVQGTEYVVKVHADGSTEYWVLSGEITATTPSGEVITISAGEGVVIHEDGTVGAKFELTEEQLNDGFVDFNQCVLDGIEECVESEVVTPGEPDASPSPVPSPTETTSDETLTPESPAPTDDPGDGGDGEEPPPAPDTTPPETLLTGGPSGVTKSSAATFTFSSNESGSFACALDGGSFTACSSPTSVGPLADGTHSFQVRATDVAGNPDPTPASRTWTVDATAPETTITSGPGGEEPAVRSAQASADPPTAAFEFESNEPGSTFECSIDGGAFASCSPPHVTPPLLDGSHDFAVRAIDPVGNVDQTPASRSWSVDANSPETTLTSTPTENEGEIDDGDATFGFESSEDGSSFQCALADGTSPPTEGYEACTSTRGYQGLGDGDYTFAVFATDAHGNVDPTPATWQWSVDENVPTVTITEAPDQVTESTTATFEFEADESVDHFECARDGAAFAACASGVSYSGLSQGIHLFQVKAIDDGLGRTSDVESWSWRIGNAEAISISLAWSSGPTDLDTYVVTPNGHTVYYGDPYHVSGAQCTNNNRSGCWVSLDRDDTDGRPGNETITIDPNAPGFVAGSYTVYIENFSCNGTFGASGASVQIFGGGANSTFNAGASNLKRWNIGSISITSAGAATVTSTNTYSGSSCGGSILTVARHDGSTAEAMEVAGTPAPAPQVWDAGGDGSPSMSAEVDGDEVRVEWEPAGPAEVRYGTEEYAERIEEGEEGCDGVGSCEFDVPEGADTLYLTLFPEGEREADPEESVNAVRLNLADEGPGGETSQGDGDGSSGGNEDAEVPPSTPPDEDDPAPDPPQEDGGGDPAPSPDYEPEPEPEPTQDPAEVDSSAEGENATA